MPQIWQSFFRGDTSHKRESSRFGLGLSIVSAIMKMHNSSCGVYNTENGERIGTLACPNYQIGAGEQELKIADVNGDKSNDIGVIMQNSTVIWYKYSPNKEYSKDNPNGRFEAIG